ncbi:MAG TPA: PAS domain S-box protein [Candidatus Acidoferrales bacterium]|nr:PAS domain S-box protein [Candidatus Acidoferrales bacterium]
MTDFNDYESSPDFSDDIIAAASCGILAYNEAGQCVLANPAAAGIIGTTVADLLHQNFRELSWWREGGLLALAETVLARGEKQQGEFHSISTFGKVLWLSCKLSVFVKAGRRYLLLIIDENTTRRHTEEAFVNGEERCRALFEQAHDAIFVADAKTGQMLDANQQGQQLTGYTLAEIREMHQSKLHPPEQVEDVKAGFREDVRAGLVKSRESTLMHRNGTWIPVEISARVIRIGQQELALGIFRDLTERKQAEKAQRESELLLRSILENTQEVIFVKDRECRFVYMNPAGYRLNGLTPEKLIGRSKLDFHPDPVEAEQFMMDDRRVMESTLTEMIEEIVGAADGSKHVFLTTKVARRDSQGKVIGLIGVARDITERKQAEQKLRESQALYHSLVTQMPIGIFRKDAEGRFVLVNPGFCQLKGMKAEDFLGKTPLEVAAEESARNHAPVRANRYSAAGEQHHRQIMQTGKPMELDEEYVLADGGKQCVHVMKFPVLDADGKVVGSQGVQFDITERRLAEERMHLQSSALTAAANAIVITDRTGKIEWINPAFTKLTGYSAEEAVGATPRLLKSGQHDKAFYANLWATITSGKVWHGELINQRKDGRLYTEDMTITPVCGTDAEIAHFVAIKLDVTERRQLEDRLQQAQKMEAIGTLAGGIAHDFNNILAAIFGYTSLLQQDTESIAAAQEDAAEILKAASRAKDLVQQILTFSRRREQKRQVIQLGTVIKEAAKFLRASLPAQISIEVNLAEDTPAVLADPTQIYQIAVNLGTNALHAMDSQAGQLTLSLEPFLPDDNFIQSRPEFRLAPYVRLTVADTGHGMDSKTLARIFEPFFTTKPVGKGTGLGLAVVHGLVQAHGGAITVASQVGVGTTFCLYFPAQLDLPAVPDATAPTLPPGRGQKILLVDDEPAVARTLQRLLARQNYEVTSRTSAREAMALFLEDPARFDLIITDLTMPEMSGSELARQLRARRQDLPILLATGFTADFNLDNLKAAGISEVLEKPVAMAALAGALQRVFPSSNNHEGGRS